jgi:uncharacterized protein (DUF58 family)
VAANPTNGHGAWQLLQPVALARLQNLLFAAKVIVEGAFAGRHRSPYKGSAAEFIDYREYNPGDEIRTIDWKAYARSDRHYIKLFQTETDMNAYMLVDCSASMGYGGPAYKRLLGADTVSKLDYAKHLAAAMAFLLIRQGDRVGLTIFDNKIQAHRPPGGTFPHLYTLLDALDGQAIGKQTSLSGALRTAYSVIKRRGLLIVISDFLDDVDEVVTALNMYRHRGFEVLLFHVMHPYERELPPMDSINFVDAESGAMMTSKSADIAEGYKAQIEGFIDALRSAARARGISHRLVLTDEPYSDVLRDYLFRRGKA